MTIHSEILRRDIPAKFVALNIEIKLQNILLFSKRHKYNMAEKKIFKRFDQPHQITSAENNIETVEMAKSAWINLRDCFMREHKNYSTNIARTMFEQMNGNENYQYEDGIEIPCLETSSEATILRNGCNHILYK
ncbi:uncharacterized protein LOC135923881 isoform X2 [Gordionus sp. m RMFG-2023]|uniref:uncharacterized protein LOC135923881 isoform X2 n=1 Tax=Gordionus sp. m RMFG-2023 TaxID=3053472 RepID=UPI0031FCE488